MIRLPLGYRVVLGAVLCIGLSMVLNPWIVKPDYMHDPVGEGILIVEGLLGIGWLACVCIVRFRRTVPPAGCAPEHARADPPLWRHWTSSRCTVPLLLIMVLGLWLVMHRHRVLRPELGNDDYHYIEIARSWASTRENLFTPYNEHLCVPTRLLTWAVCAVFQPAWWPRVLAWSGMAIFAASFVPLYLFVRREWNSPWLGVLAVSLFALTTVHREVVTWYSASQWCWAMLLLLTSLLVLQRGEATPRGWRLWIGALLAAIGPLCYAVGVFVGPIASLSLVLRRRFAAAPIGYRCCAAPLVGTLLCLAVLMPIKAQGIVERARYGGLPPSQAISPLGGVLFGVRSTVDLLVLRNLAMERTERLPRVWYAMLFPVIAFAVGECILRASNPAPLLLGCAIVLLSNALTLPFRAWVEYATFLSWTRYQLFPQLGLVLFACGVLASFGPGWTRASEVSRRHALLIGGLSVLQFLIHEIAQ